MEAYEERQERKTEQTIEEECRSVGSVITVGREPCAWNCFLSVGREVFGEGLMWV